MIAKYTLIFFFIFFGLFLSCEQPVQNVIIPESEFISKVHEAFLQHNNQSEFTPDWENAEIYNLREDESLITIPVSRKKSVSYGDLDFTRKLVLVYSNGTIISSHIIEIVSKDYLSSKSSETVIIQYFQNSILTYFSGLIIHRDINYNLSRLLEFRNGVENVNNEIDLKLNENPELEFRTNNGSNCTDWYWVTYWSNGSVTEEYLYTTCDNCETCETCETCIDSGNGGGGPSGDSGENEGIDCASFIFVSTNSTWQESAVTNIGFKVKVLNPYTNSYTTSEFRIDRPVWFGLPTLTHDGRTISFGEASELAASAVQYTSDLTHLLYLENPSTPISTAESFFLNFLKSKCKLPRISAI